MTFQKGDAIVNNHVLYALGGGLIPFPLIDIAAVTAIQLDMVKQLCKLYGADYNENSGKHWITALAGSTLAKLGASFVKAIPLVGGILGGISMSVLSGASTYGIGQVFLKHLESEGTLINFDAEKMKDAYNEAFEKGKEVAQNLKKEMDARKKNESKSAKAVASDTKMDIEDAIIDEIPKSAPEPTPEPEDTFTKLERLAAMREKGLISDEEFRTMKSRLLGEF